MPSLQEGKCFRSCGDFGADADAVELSPQVYPEAVHLLLYDAFFRGVCAAWSLLIGIEPTTATCYFLPATYSFHAELPFSVTTSLCLTALL